MIIGSWSPEDSGRVQAIKRARQKLRGCHDDILLASNKSYLLFATTKGLYLISRNDPWKHPLTAEDETLYRKVGKSSFRVIRRRNK